MGTFNRGVHMSTFHSSENIPAVLPTPLQIDFVATPCIGSLAMSACPGLTNRSIANKSSLEADVSTIYSHRILTVISLMETQELQRAGAKNLSYYLGKKKISWHQLQVSEYGAPSIAVIHQWRRLVKPLIMTLESGGNVLIHCLEGNGRTGVMTACLLKALGLSGEAAIAQVRRARQGVFQTSLQEDYVLSFRPQKPIG